MSTEVIYEDGSTSTIHKDGGSSHVGGTSINRFRLITAKHALEMYLLSNGSFQLTANGAQLAIRNVISPMTGKTYKRSMNGKREALADCIALIAEIENAAVIWTEG